MASEPQIKLDRSEFLHCHRFSESEVDATGLDWALLETICSIHSANIPQLRTTADYISQRLREIPAVHSLKVRVKHPEHLIAKIIRKKIDNPDLSINPETYSELITDLVGI